MRPKNSSITFEVKTPDEALKNTFNNYLCVYKISLEEISLTPYTRGMKSNENN